MINALIAQNIPAPMMPKIAPRKYSVSENLYILSLKALVNSPYVKSNGNRYDGGYIHAGSVKENVAERVVAHLTAGHVPGDGNDNHKPQSRELCLEIRKQEGCRQNQGDEKTVENEAFVCHR